MMQVKKSTAAAAAEEEENRSEFAGLKPRIITTSDAYSGIHRSKADMSMKGLRFVLHVGPNKTGTTTVQVHMKLLQTLGYLESDNWYTMEKRQRFHDGTVIHDDFIEVANYKLEKRADAELPMDCTNSESVADDLLRKTMQYDQQCLPEKYATHGRIEYLAKEIKHHLDDKLYCIIDTK